MNTTNHTSPIGEDAANEAMGEREAFEAWWLKDVPENHRDFAKKLLTKYGQDYAEAPGVADAWTTWQASRRAALEEAIRATAQAKTTSHACDAIRALSGPTEDVK